MINLLHLSFRYFNFKTKFDCSKDLKISSKKLKLYILNKIYYRPFSRVKYFSLILI